MFSPMFLPKMITVEAICYKYKSLKNGEFPIKIKITKDRKTRYVNLDVFTKMEDWDFKNNRPKECHPDKEQLDILISNKIREIKSKIIELKSEGKDFSATTLVEKVSKVMRPLKRGDIVVFYPPDERLKKDVFSVFSRLTGIFCKDIAYIKRIIGVEGDKFEIKQDNNGDWYVYINDIPLDEPYILSKSDWTPCRDDMYCGPFVIPEGQYFMMGDNRSNSQDSRFWGFLPKERVIGRAYFVFWPLNRIEMLNKYAK